ncbi:putative cytochrome p450 protein [Neofusicoccum parvum UCRNP2]|uniref:Putative cytochrome p450 protein n=1 Tax=Botryosphaeria parva (strain UCR-NP2) TaxID=1287680 RepID=R1GNB2_BOTPV|nr:putative cytochrome p450 protein [Neofusicoccum parvum UCRNP2]
MHDQYGPIIRITPNELHVRDSSWFDVLYASNPTHRDKYPPAAQLAGLPLGTHGTVQHDLHRKRRTANAPMFSKRAVASAQDLIREHVNELAEVFATKVGNDEPVELQTTFLAYTTDTIYHYMFDKDSGYQRNPEAAKSWRRSMLAVSQATPFMKQFPWLLSRVMLLPDWVLQWGLTRAQPDVAGLLGTHKLMAEIVSNYIATGRTQPDADKKIHDEERAFTKPKTIFQAIEDSALPAHEKSPSRLAQEGLTVLFAGGETGSRVLANTVYHLLANPDILIKVKEEIFEAAEGSEKLPDVKVLERLPWLVTRP